MLRKLFDPLAQEVPGGLIMYNQNIQNLQTDQMKQNEMLDEYAVYVMCDICTQKVTKENHKRRSHLGGTIKYGGIIFILVLKV